MRYLNPAHHDPAKIRKIDKDFAKKLDFKHWHAKLEILYIVSVILVMRKEKHSQSTNKKKLFKRQIDL